MQIIRFDRHNGALRVEVRAGWANPGAYDLILWEADSNARVMEEAGNFLNTADDSYTLPGPASAQDGRIVEAFVTLTPVDEHGRYSASMRVSQGAQLLGDVSVSGESSEHTVMLDLFARLEAIA